MRTWLYDPGRLGGKGAVGETRQAGGPGTRGAGSPASGLEGADEGQPPVARSSSPVTPCRQRAQFCQST